MPSIFKNALERVKRQPKAPPIKSARTGKIRLISSNSPEAPLGGRPSDIHLRCEPSELAISLETSDVCRAWHGFFLQREFFTRLSSHHERTPHSMLFPRYLLAVELPNPNICKLCQWVLPGIVDYYKKAGRSFEDVQAKSESQGGRSADMCFYIDMEEKSVNRPDRFLISFYEAPSCSWQVTGAEIAIVADHESLLKRYISDRPVNGNVTDNRTFDLIRAWLNKCNEWHTSCKSCCSHPGEKKHPTRLLDVSKVLSSSGATIKLSKVDRADVRYTALSYVWGATQHDRTTVDNLLEHENGINLHSLPQTIQDAIWVTRRLSVQYLWVDSMCIIQDSEEDKQTEIGKMAAIYRNAWVTISAASANTCNAGFLKARDSRLIHARCHMQSPDGTIGTAELQMPKADFDWSNVNVVDDEPIDSRAWTLQERFLSHRLLLFSEHQVFWTCSDEWGKDGGVMTHSAYWESRDWNKRGPGRLRGRCPIQHSRLRTPGLEDWLMLAKEYCQKAISEPADKLPAISSLAEYFASAWNDVYLAGLWRSYLIPSLLWGLGNGKNSRPSAWRAPSWSFFSLDGEIGLGRIPYDKAEELEQPGYEVGGQRFECVLLSATVEPLSRAAPFGKIISASLTLKAHIMQVIPWGEHFSFTLPKQFYRWYRYDTVEDGWEPDGTWYCAKVNTNYGPLEHGEPLWILPLLGNGREGPRDPMLHYEGLLLARRPTGEYHRVGVSSMSLYVPDHQSAANEQAFLDYFRGTEPAVITII